jgi:hypothetical protein
MTLFFFPHADVAKGFRPDEVNEQTEPIASSATRSATSEPPHQVVPSDLPFLAEAALARANNDRELLRQMTGIFAMQWNNLWVEILKTCQNRDGATLQLTANKLKRSVESFEAVETSRVAQELEMLGIKCDFHDVHKTCARLKSEIERLVTALKEFTNAPATPT